MQQKKINTRVDIGLNSSAEVQDFDAMQDLETIEQVLRATTVVYHRRIPERTQRS